MMEISKKVVFHFHVSKRPKARCIYLLAKLVEIAVCSNGWIYGQISKRHFARNQIFWAKSRNAVLLQLEDLPFTGRSQKFARA